MTTSEKIKECAFRLQQGFYVSTDLFQHTRKEFQEQSEESLQKIYRESFSLLESIAAAELQRWERESERKQNYTAKELAEAKARMQMLNGYRLINAAELALLNGVHQSIVSMAIENSEVAKEMCAEGRAGKKLVVVETSARLSPCLTFVGSSDYLHATLVPYGKEARAVLGEQLVKSLVSKEAVEESARNAQRLFGVDMVLAETSAAPRDEVPKSRRQPEVYLCELRGGKSRDQLMETTHHIIDTPFREEFNCRVRELLYFSLQRMYNDA